MEGNETRPGPLSRGDPLVVEFRSRFDKLEARAEKLEALAYEERARQREQQIQIDTMAAERSRFHATIGRWVERIVFGAIASIAWFWDKLVGS